MSRHFVLDFDGTLIDTDVYWQWIIQQFLELGHDEQKIREVGEKLFPLRYTVFHHASNMGMDDHAAKALAQRARAHVLDHHASLIFPDVEGFFDRNTDAEKSVLTFGDESHQTERVVASGLESYLKAIQIASPEVSKAALLAEMLKYTTLPVMFVDDDVEQLGMVHEQGLPIELIRMRRPGQRKSVVDHELDHKAWRVIESFDELE